MARNKPNKPPLVDHVEIVGSGENAAADARERGRRRLRRGSLARISDRLTGGAERPGEQQIGRSPLILSLGFVILGLAIVGGVFYFLIIRENESRRFQSATAALEEARYTEAEQLFERFLKDYPSGNSCSAARISLHKTRVRRYTDGNNFSVNSVVEALREVETFVRVCRDLPGYEKEQENLVRYAQKITEAAAQVAVDQASQEALDTSRTALTRLEQFTSGGNLSGETREKLIRMQRRADAAILKRRVLQSSLAEIRKTRDEGETLAAIRSWQDLIRRYEVLSDDAEFQTVLSEVLEKERDHTTAEELEANTGSDTTDQPPRPSVSLNLNTQASASLVSQNRRVFAWGGDSCYALDSETGVPLWKVPVGTDLPFPPVTLETSEPSLLVFLTEQMELRLLRQQDGQVIWRQPFDALPTGPPLILDQQIYLTTQAGDLRQLSAGTGRGIARVKFSQPVLGPPAVSHDGRLLVLPGRESLVYTLTRRPLECTAVSHTAHRQGSVGAPMISMGLLYLMCENHSVERATLHALEMTSEPGTLVRRESRTVEGQIQDSCLLRGDQLFVPSTPQRVTAFRVSDRPESDVLSRIGTNQLENAGFASMHLLPGPGGDLWMASTSLRRFRVTTNAILLDDVVVTEGQHLYPMHLVDDSLYLATRKEWSSSVFFTRASRTSMKGIWRTVLSTNIVAAGPSSSGQSLLAVSDYGEVFRVPLQKPAGTEFHLESLSRFRLPDGLTEPVGGLELPDGRLAAWCGGGEPAVWTITEAGHLEQRWTLSAAPETDPVPLAGGVVAALPGRLHLTASGRHVDDYRASSALNQHAVWKQLVAVSASELLAVNADDKLVRVEYRTRPRPHLAEVSITQIDSSIDVAPVAGGDFLVLVTLDGRLVLMRTATLEIIAEQQLDGVTDRPAVISGDRIFVDVGGREIRVFEPGEKLRSTGSIRLNRDHLAGRPMPLAEGGFLAALSSGRILRLDANGNPTGPAVQLSQRLQQGPVRVGDNVLVIALDGSIYPLTDLLQPRDSY